MTASISLPISEILATDPAPGGGREIGRSVDGLPLFGHLLGHGPIAVSLIGGCHADEPVGPEMLERLAAFLAAQRSDHPVLTAATWVLIPRANPDGDALNAAWTTATRRVLDCRGEEDRGYDLSAYLRHVVRELPGDDVEFGFPRHEGDLAARPENRAIAAFLAAHAPFALHGSFHGMAFAPGPWFLIEPGWVSRTASLRANLRRLVAEMGYAVFDVDRRGEKGFRRIDAGFSTRPDSRAMIDHFRRLNEPETAALFRPSSMELVRRLSGDAFTFVSEMPLFVRPEIADPLDEAAPPSNVGTENRLRFHDWLRRLVTQHSPDGAMEAAARHGIRPMPLRDQMRLQLALLNEALAAVGNGRPARCLATALLGLTALLGGACAPAGNSNGAQTVDGLRGQRPVVLITLDTTRADHLESYGAAAGTTPHLASLADAGVVFEHAYAVSPVTLPSHASLLTGLDPRQHGVRSNEIHRLGERIPTLAERLREAGFHTGAFVSAAVLERRYGLDRGFELYDDRLDSNDSGLRRPVAERAAAGTVDAARAWLDGLPVGEPFFLWVHLYDPHSAYDPPPPFAERFAENLYAGEIAYMDSEIGRLLAHPLLGTESGPGAPVILAIGDHGEGLGEHGEETHGLLLYDSTLRIPWIVRIPGGPGGRRVEWAVSQIDLMPTVLDLMGLLDAGLDSDLPGQSLLERFLERLPDEPPAFPVDQLHGRFLYAESHVAFHLYGWAKLHSLRRERYKLVDSPLPELFDTGADPPELENLVAVEPRIAGLLYKRLAELTLDGGGRAADRPPIDSAARSRLESLGYLSSGVDRRETDEDIVRPDPKEMMDVHQSVNRAERLLAAQRTEESLAELDGVLVIDPLNVIALRYRGEALWALGRHDEAASAFERALGAEPENPLVALRLAILEGRRDNLERALELVEAALAHDPSLLDARLERARFLSLLGRRDEARRLVRAALEEAPDDPWVNLRYAQLVELPDESFAAAVQRLRSLVERDPLMGEAWWLLAEAWRLAGQDRQAVAAAREGVARLPADSRLHAQLGLALATLGDDQAGDALREAIRLSPATEPELLNALGDWLEARGRHDEARRVYLQSAELPSRSPADRNDRAIALYRMGRQQDAVAIWRELARQEPEFAGVRSNLAAAHLAQRDWREAERLARQAVELDPRLASAWSTLGAALLEQRRWEESTTAFLRAAQLDPRDWRSSLHSGKLLAQSRRFTEAAAAYEAVLRLRPDEADAHYELGLLFSGPLNDPERARFHLLAGLAAQPDHPRSELAHQALRDHRSR